MRIPESPNPLARRQILAAAEATLRRAGVEGVLPTPLDAVRKAAGIREVVDMADLPPELAKQKPRKWRRILGAYVYRERVVFLDRSQTGPRQRFVEAHEIGHRIVPWHDGVFQLDNEEHVFHDTEQLAEAEAKLAGAHIIFQGSGFAARARDFTAGIASPMALASDYGVSLHVTIRHYVEHHPEAVALLVLGRFSDPEGLPIFQAVQSPSFEQKYGPVSDRFRTNHVGIGEGQKKPLGDILRAVLDGEPTPSKQVGLRDLGGDPRRFIAEAFFNQYSVFLMLIERRAARFGRRVRVAAA